MARMRFLAVMDPQEYRVHGIGKTENLFVVRYEELYSKRIREQLRKIVKRQDENVLSGKLDHWVELDVSVDIHYRKRSVDANALLWSLLTIKANELNGGLRGPQEATPEQLYDEYMALYCPKFVIKVDTRFLYDIVVMIEQQKGHVKGKKQLNDQETELEIWRTSSFYNTKEFHDLLEIVFADLSAMGVHLDGSGDIEKYWADFQLLKKQEAEAVPEEELY